MKLNTLLTAAATLLVAGLLTLPQPADARRMGGGGNVGKQYNTPSQSATPAQAQRPTQAQGAAAAGTRAPGGASRWLGPLAGLAAGGLLASMFMGGGFEGFKIMDFLLIAGLVIGAVMLFRMLRRRQAGPVHAAAGAYGRTTTLDQGVRSGGFTPSGMGSAAPVAAGSDQFPVWFDGAGFIEGAKSHFVNLQAAWDRGDFQDLKDYVTPQMLAELRREFDRIGGPQTTEVVRLQAELLTLQRDGDQAVASVLFSGLIREDAQAAAQEFREVWHVQHAWASAAGDWYIAGIQQQA
ncbi:MAG TPA: Tim44-like domain-containing protein [Lamprocystis sp. (in: g-proteobacteria)]|nr:Tim44-like domain-containing protein [Lamprocystis sp. (in: g-proteobacteria)]